MKVENKDGQALVFTRTFAAPRELVFKAWTTAAMVKNWWGCGKFPACDVEMDARPGGRWRGCLRSDAGDEIQLAGKFIEVVRPERLVFTFVREAAPEIGVEPVDTRVTVTFTEQAGKTLMQFRQEIFTTTELRDNHQDGWTTSFARLDNIFATQEAVAAA
ncbi:MAG: SRPBCC domain-containing protein [Verrucomicrobiae bacterium]|nr:SRPBCC domain-containing protein [Verrucomicrobiae bacterium]